MDRELSGNFDNQNARDYLMEMVLRFEKFIEDILAGGPPKESERIGFRGVGDLDVLSSKAMNVQVAGESYLMPTVEFICLLHEGIVCDYLPEPHIVARWADEYFRQMEPVIERLGPDERREYEEIRRPQIQATFARLMRHSQWLEDESKL